MSIEHCHETIIILDFGSQYTQLIARKIRELNVFSEISQLITMCPDLAEDSAEPSFLGTINDAGLVADINTKKISSDNEVIRVIQASGFVAHSKIKFSFSN